MTEQSKIQNRQGSAERAGAGRQSDSMKTVKTQRSVVNENAFCFGDKWVELPKLEIAFHLKNLQTRYDTDSSVGCKERVAASYECNRHLDRTGRLEFERCSELCRGFEEMAIKLDKPQPSAIGQQSLITIGKCRIAPSSSIK